MLLRLQNIALNAPLQQTGSVLLLAELILPRNGIARRSALKALRLTGGVRSLRRASLSEAGLLKERVDGPFGLRVAVTRPLVQPELWRFLRRLAAAGVESALELLPTLDPLSEALAEEAAETLADRMRDSAPAWIAAGTIDLDSEALRSGTVTLPLKLTQSIRDHRELKPSQRRDKRKMAGPVHRAGTKVGQIVLAIEA